MCETATINRSIVRLSKQSFTRRIDFLSSTAERERIALTRLNNSLVKLNDLLYEAYPTVTEADYEQFGPYLKILVSSLQELIKVYRASSMSRQLSESIAALRSHYKALIEIDSDIRNFRIEIQKSQRFNSIMDKLKAI